MTATREIIFKRNLLYNATLLSGFTLRPRLPPFPLTTTQPVIGKATGKGPWAIVPLTWKMAYKSVCRLIRNGPLKISKSLKKAENGPFGKNLFPITAQL